MSEENGMLHQRAPREHPPSYDELWLDVSDRDARITELESQNKQLAEALKLAEAVIDSALNALLHETHERQAETWKRLYPQYAKIFDLNFVLSAVKEEG